MEGDFGTDIFSTIHVDFYPCKNNTSSGIICKTEEDIQKALKDNFFSIYVSDSIIDTKNF